MERPAFRRPEPSAIAAGVVVAAGLVVAIIVGHLVGNGTRAAESPPPSASGFDLPGTDGWRPLGWSPDGTALLATREGRIGIVTEGTSPEELDASLISWWPGDGRTLSYVSRGASADRLILRDRDGTERTVVEAPVIQVVAWSNDGQTWAISSENGLSTGLLGGAATLVSSDRSPLLAVSPSGERLAFARGDLSAGRLGALVVQDLLRDEVTWLSSLKVGGDDVLIWSPTGRFLAVTARRDAEQGVFLLPAGGSDPVLALSDVDRSSLRWSPDGLWLAAARLAQAGPVTELVVAEVRAVSVGTRSLGPGRATVWGPLEREVTTIDPDGRLVAHAVDGARATVLAEDAEPVCDPAASVASHRVAYCQARGGIRVVEETPE